MSPFAVIVAKPGLAVHVREIGPCLCITAHTMSSRTVVITDIFFAPPLKAFPHPQFIRECIQTLKLCANLWILKCTTNIVPSLLLSMQHKPRLRVLRANANLTRDQALILTTLTGLRVLTVGFIFASKRRAKCSCYAGALSVRVRVLERGRSTSSMDLLQFTDSQKLDRTRESW
jgi:hypothetical protein